MLVTDERVARFVSERIGYPVVPPYTCLGSERGGEIEAGIIFHCFEGSNVHVTAAGRKWSRRLFRATGEYVFGQLGCERMTFTTEQPKVIDYVKRLGGRVEGVLRSQFGKGRDGTIIGVLRDEWRY